MLAAESYDKEVMPLITVNDLFTFVIMLCAIITLVIVIIKHKEK